MAKQNAIADLSASLQGCSGLQKLSMAHNRLTALGGSLAACTGLKELRLNHNALVRLPPDLARNAQLRILDLGDNAVAKAGAVKVLCSSRMRMDASSQSRVCHASTEPSK